LPVATGVKAANPDLQVWVITGDGDGLSIGGNHLIHALRRNVDLKVILFNNEIYGLTKGQFSPTSVQGIKTKTSPMGSIDAPLSPSSFALACGAGFVARTTDNDVKHLSAVLEAAAKFKGSAFIEVMQNCVIFNDGAHASFASTDNRKINALYMEHGQPLAWDSATKGVFGKGFGVETKEITDANRSEVIVHDLQEETGALAWNLAQFENPERPVPLGVFRAVERTPYHELMDNQIKQARSAKGSGDLNKLLHDGFTWKV